MKTFTENRKARFDYEILDKFDAGIELLGLEVKSIKSGKVSLDGSHVIIRGGEAYLIGSTIQPYQPKNTPSDYDSTITRKLLLTKKELNDLEKRGGKKGLTIVPLSLYNKGKGIKIEIAVVRGKKKFDKRETIKKRDTDREIERTLKSKR